MHDLAVLLLEEGRRHNSTRGDSGVRPALAVDLLYERLRPVIGARGFHALFVRAMGTIGDRRPSLATVASCQTSDQGLKELHMALREPSVDADNRDAVVLDLLETLLGTLERMIGAELTQRLATPDSTGAGRRTG